MCVGKKFRNIKKLVVNKTEKKLNKWIIIDIYSNDFVLILLKTQQNSYVRRE